MAAPPNHNAGRVCPLTTPSCPLVQIYTRPSYAARARACVRRQYAEGKFNEFAARHETIECTAAIAPGKHPQLIGEYANGARHSIGVKNLGEADIVRRVELLRNRAGYKVQTRDAFNRVIRTTGSGSVQGVWGGVGPARDVVDPKMPRLRKTRT